MASFDHQSREWLEIDDAKIYYEIQGRDSDPALLLLHGGFGNMEDFNIILPRLSRNFRVIGIDSRGQGKSTPGTAALTYARMQKDVERILSHLRLDNLNIIGFSDGGIVAYRLTAQSSVNIEKLVTIGSRWELKSDDPTREIFAKITGDSWRAKFPAMYDAYQKLNPQPNFDFLTESVVKMWLDGGPSGHPNETVKHISCDLLIVRGDDDHLVSRETVVELSRHIKNSRLLNIPFAGHAAFEDQTELFMLSLNEFLKAE